MIDTTTSENIYNFPSLQAYIIASMS